MNLIDQITVRDDVIPTYLQDFYELITLGTHNGEILKHFFASVPYTYKYEPTAQELLQNSLSFFHNILGSSGKSYLEDFAIIPELMCKAQGTVLTEIMTARIYVQLPRNIEPKHWNKHIDLPNHHYSLIYYVNDADGATVLFDGQKIIKEVEPKKGRILLFNGSIYHGAGIPKTTNRCVVNFNIDFK